MIVRSIFIAGLLTALLNFLFPLIANAVDLPDQKVSIQQDKIGLRDALTSLLEETKFHYTLSNNVTNEKKISMDFKEMAWDEIFKFVLSEGNLNYRITAKNRILVSP